MTTTLKRIRMAQRDVAAHRAHAAETRLFGCEDATPSHSYAYFDGRSGAATVSRDLKTIVYHHPTGGDFNKRDLSDLEYTWSQKGTNSIAARAAIEAIREWLRS